MIVYGELVGQGANLQPRGSYLSGVTISLSAINGLPQNTGPSFGINDPNISFFGGYTGTFGTTYPKSLFKTTYDLTYSDGTKGGIQGRVAFETDATSFDMRLYSTGATASFTLLVDGKEVNSTMYAMPQDGSLRYISVDLSGAGLSPGFHTIEFEFQGGANFGGLTLSSGASLRPLSDSGPRLVFLGDSFTEGNGALNKAEDYPSIVARSLGIPDSWQSAFGGTGWITSFNNRPALIDRIVPDGVQANGDIYVIAMGINDTLSLSGLYDGVVSTLTQLTQGKPLAKIFVIGPWNVSGPAPNPKVSYIEAIRDAVAQFQGVVFLDPSNVTYTKADATHPDSLGHWTLGEWVAEQIKQNLGADGLIEQNVAGDVVGPVFLKGYDPNETYQATVLENGQVSSRFELVLNGTPYPILRLLESQSVAATAPINVSIHVTGSLGTDLTTNISFNVRQHYIGDSANNYIRASNSGGFIEGLSGNDYLIGGSSADRLLGGPGDDKLDGGTGADTMAGGAGNDSYWVDNIADTVTELAGEGYDVLNSSVNGYVLPDNFEAMNLLGAVLSGSGNDGNNYLRGNQLANLLYGRGGNDSLFGDAGNDTLYGDAGNDSLDGGTGADTMSGGLGNDNYFVDDAGDQVNEAGNAGIDQVISKLANYTLPTNVELLTLDVGAVNGTGNNLDNKIYGNAGDNVLLGMDGNDELFGGAGADTLKGGTGNDNLDGGTGADTMYGGLGNDNYFVDDAGDQVIEASNEGTDQVISRLANYTLPANVELLTLDVGAVNGTGNNLANKMYGNAGDNALFGMDGNDELYGGAGADTLNGGMGDDKLDGGTGADTMAGGAGNDSYWVDNIADTVTELAGEGYDVLNSSVNGYVLPDNFEAMNLLGAVLSGSGNDGNNYLRGNQLANVLYGRDGDDKLDGFAGNDTLYGDAGSDNLDGGTGADTMYGGLGNDNYFVDDAGDQVIEASNEGTDQVISRLANYTLPANVELLTLDVGAVNGTGNNLANKMYGNAGDNALFGMDGNDELYGGAGNNILDGGSGFDIAKYVNAFSDYSFTFSGSTLLLTNTQTGNTDTIMNVESLYFSNGYYSVDYQSGSLNPY